MMRCLLVALALLCAGDVLAGTKGAQPFRGGRGSGLLTHLPFTSTGGLIPDDANTVCHAWFNGTAIQDTKGCAWTQNGTVPQNIASPFYPTGFSGANQKGAGPLGPNNYSLGSGMDVLDFAGDFSMCVVHIGSPVGSTDIINNQDAGATLGWRGPVGNTCFLRTNPGAVTVVGGTPTPEGINVCCVGRSGTTLMAKLNLDAIVTQAGSTITRATASPAVLGGGLNRTLYEFWAADGTTPSDALFTSIARRIFGMLGTKGEPITVARTSVGTYTTPDGLIWTAPAGVARVGCEDAAATKCGILVEPARTNLALQSEALDNVAWTATNVTVTANQCVLPIGPSGTTTLESLASTVNTGTVAQAVTVTSSVGPHTVSGYFRATTGTQTGSIGMTFGTGNATSCTCVRSDGGTCTVATSTSTGFAYGSFTAAAAVRMMLTCSTTLAATTVTAFATGGQYLTSTGTVCGGAMQFEQASPYSTSYIATAGTAVARTTDVVSVANPLTNPSGWCVETVATPENGSPWAQAGRTAGINLEGTPNAVQFRTGSSLVFGVHDAAGAFRSWTQAAPHGFTDGSVHTIAWSYVTTPQPSLLIDGVASTLAAPVGAGTGILGSQAATAYVGGNSTGGAGGALGGYTRNFKVYKRACR